MPDSEAREKRGKTLKCGREEALKVKIYPLGFLKILFYERGCPACNLVDVNSHRF